MANLIERIASLFSAKGSTTQSSYGRGPYAKYRVQLAIQGYDPRRGASMLRAWSRNNEWVRLAIDYRREQISMAQWKIVRLDDDKKPPDPRVVAKVRKLFAFVNPMREAFEDVLDMVIEDMLVLDAGCIEKEKTVGGDIVALWPVDGATIVPDPTWDGSDPGAPRYFQIIEGVEVASLRNDQLIYAMRTPTTYSPIGWSPVETLMRAIEADLYGEQYDFMMLKQTAPAGVLSLGAGVSTPEVEAFREYYESEIAGTKDLAIFGGGEPGAGAGVTWTPFNRSNREQERHQYKEWLVKKIAAVFRIDKGIFNITESVNRATSKTNQQRTDEGLKALANAIQRRITREIIWEIDENHGFQFENLNDRDIKAEADVDAEYVGAGIWTVNEVRARQGLDPVSWGDAPYVPATGPVSPEVPEPPEDDPEDGAGGDDPKPGDDENENEDATRSAERAVPFVAAARTPTANLSYLANFVR